jgi:tryptophan-rich sensory protein
MSSPSSTIQKKPMLEKLLKPGWKPTPTTFPELPDCIFWIRFFIAIFYGIYIGLEEKSRGGVNLMFALNLVTFIPVFYATTYLGASQEEFGAKLIFGGVMQGLALTILIWVYMYTGSHPQDEAAFASVFGKLMEASTVADGSEGAGESASGTTGSEF